MTGKKTLKKRSETTEKTSLLDLKSPTKPSYKSKITQLGNFRLE